MRKKEGRVPGKWFSIASLAVPGLVSCMSAGLFEKEVVFDAFEEMSL